MQSLKKFSPESIRAIARNPNIDLQSIGFYSKSDIPSSTSSDTNSDISVFHTISQFNNSKLPTNLPTLNPLLLPIPKPTPRIFHNPLFNPSTPVNHYHPFSLPLMHPKSPQHIPYPSLTDQPTIPQIFHRFPQN